MTMVCPPTKFNVEFTPWYVSPTSHFLTLCIWQKSYANIRSYDAHVTPTRPIYDTNVIY